MTQNNPTHPSTDHLSAFVSGRLGESESLEIERHVTACDACRSVLEALPDGSLECLLLMPSALPEEAPGER
jgi:anti-sigma factor RsiW